MPIYLTVAYVIFVTVPLAYAASLLFRRRRLEQAVQEMERQLEADQV